MKNDKPAPKTLADVGTDQLKLRGFEIYQNIERSVATIEQHKASIEQGYKEIGVINAELRRRQTQVKTPEVAAPVVPVEVATAKPPVTSTKKNGGKKK